VVSKNISTKQNQIVVIAWQTVVFGINSTTGTIIS